MQGFGKGNTAIGRDSWQDLEERGRTERSESGTGGVGQKDTVGACAATRGAKRRNGTRNSKKNRDSNNRATLIHWNIFVSQKRGKGVPIVFYNDACIKAITKALRPIYI